MVLVIQVFGALFGLFLIYLSFLNLKRKEFTINEWLVWTLLSAAITLTSLIPELLNPFARTLNISRKMDLVIILGFIFLIATTFYMYKTTEKTQKKVEEVVRKIAIQEAENRLQEKKRS
ncbi:DUF2304 domain-containing protein [Candidatus Woesearchaeota archaeon]|nr:DUF2304 domain-containing protein [Candidatus Woesearchaeota archaeon]